MNITGLNTADLTLSGIGDENLVDLTSTQTIVGLKTFTNLKLNGDLTPTGDIILQDAGGYSYKIADTVGTSILYTNNDYEIFIGDNAYNIWFANGNPNCGIGFGASPYFQNGLQFIGANSGRVVLDDGGLILNPRFSGDMFKVNDNVGSSILSVVNDGVNSTLNLTGEVIAQKYNGITSTEIQNLSGVTSNIQTQINTAKSSAATAQSTANTAQTTANNRLLWMGVYIPPYNYIINSVVTYNNNLYVCIVACHNILPTNMSNWSLLCDTSTLQTGIDKSVKWKAGYSSTLQYEVNDAVLYNGSSYVCILRSLGNLPTNTTYWTLLCDTSTLQTGIDECVKWKAGYSSTLQYEVNDAVSYDSNSYVNILACTNILPTNTTYWTNLCPTANTALTNANNAQGSADSNSTKINSLRDDLTTAIGTTTTLTTIGVPAAIYAYSLIVDAQFTAVYFILTPTAASVLTLETVTVPALQKGISDNGTAAEDAMTRANSAYDHTVYEINTHYADTDPLHNVPIHTTVYVEEKLRSTSGVADGAANDAGNAKNRCTTLEGKTTNITTNTDTTIFSSLIRVNNPLPPYNNLLATKYSTDALQTTMDMAITGNLVSKNGVMVTKTFGIQDQSLPLYNYTFYIDELGNMTAQEKIMCNSFEAVTDVKGSYLNGDTVEGTLLKGKGILVNLTESGLPSLDINPSNQFASINEKTLFIGTLTPNNNIVIGSSTSTVTILGNINLNGNRGFWNVAIKQSDGDTVAVDRPSLNIFFTGNPLLRR